MALTVAWESTSASDMTGGLTRGLGMGSRTWISSDSGTDASASICCALYVTKLSAVNFGFANLKPFVDKAIQLSAGRNAGE